MALLDQATLGNDSIFQSRVRASLVGYVQNTVLAEASNDQQTLTMTGSPTGGSFTLANGPLNAAVAPAWNDSAQQVQARLKAALTDGDDVICTGGPFPGSVVTVIWVGNLSYAPQPKLSLSANGLTGGSSPTVAIGQSAGVAVFNHAARVLLGKQILQTINDYVPRFASMVATDGTVQADYTGGGNNQSAVTDAHINSAVALAYALFL